MEFAMIKPMQLNAILMGVIVVDPMLWLHIAQIVCALEQRSHVPTVGKQSIPLGYAMVMMTVGMVRMKLTVHTA